MRKEIERGEFINMTHVKCNGNTVSDCWECRKYFSSHSSHYCDVYNKRIIEVTCSIGGHRVFEDDGNNTGKRLK